VAGVKRPVTLADILDGHAVLDIDSSASHA
jgi:hypothetical protein